MSDKPKVPKGTKNVPCISTLPKALQSEFAEQFGTANRGDQDALAWGDQQKADMEYYRMKLDMQLVSNARISYAMNNHSAGPDLGARSILVLDRWEGGVGNLSVESRAQAIKGKLGAGLNQLMDKYRPLHLGFQRDREGLKNVIREIFGEATGDQEASMHAQAWGKMSNYVRKRLIDAGARIGKIEDWGMPQYHDSARVSKLTADEWVDFLENKIDWARMSADSGLTYTEIRSLLKEQIYPSIVTEGGSKIDLARVSGKPQGTGLLTRLRQHRFIHFKDADSWIEYQEALGTNDFVATMDNWMTSMSTNIAAMETLGPDPTLGMQHIRNELRSRGRSDKIKWLEKVYANLMGEVGVSNAAGAALGSSIRSANILMHLGNATLSMITDPVFMSMTARYNDIPIVRSLLRQIQIAAKNAVGNSDELQFVSRLGYTAEYATDRLLAAARFTDATPTKWMGRLSEMSVRASWMHNITVAGRAAFAMEYSGALGRDAAKSWDQLSKRRRMAFERVGIQDWEWDIIRNTGMVERNGVLYADINSTGRGGYRDTATKLGALINQEMAYAVPTPGVETRAWQNQGADRGTWQGEITRFGFEFKSFPITMLMMHMRRALHGSGMDGRVYGGGMIAALFILGHIASQAKDISKGRDPIALTDEDGKPNWTQITRALTQGGGLGIYGDLLLSDQTRFGSGWGETLMGPTIGLGADITGLMQQGLFAVAEDIDDEDEKEALKSRIGQFSKTYMPTLWQIRALQDRAVNKAMDAFTDGEWDRKMRRQEKRRRKEQGQENFWAEDEWLPERAPELSRAPGS